MEKLKSLNLKIKVKGLDEFREDVDQLTIEFKKLKMLWVGLMIWSKRSTRWN